MRVRLTRKLAQVVDGVDLSGRQEGDVLSLPRREAQLLLAEGWAVPISRRSNRDARGRSAVGVRAEAADTQRAVNRQRLQQLQRSVDHARFEPHAYRRLEDRLRDELHDVHARIING